MKTDKEILDFLNRQDETFFLENAWEFTKTDIRKSVSELMEDE